MEKYQRVLAYYHRRISRFYVVFDTGILIYFEGLLAQIKQKNWIAY
jgi:hypothetical protein